MVDVLEMETQSDVVKTLKILYDAGDQIAKMLTDSCYYAHYTVTSCRWEMDDITIDDSDGSCAVKFVSRNDDVYRWFADLDRMLDPKYVQSELQTVRELTDRYKAKLDETRITAAETALAGIERRERMELERLQSKYGTQV